VKWNEHYDLVGKHAILSPSRQGWLNYDDAKFSTFLQNLDAAERGTRIHAYAAESIRLGQNLPRSKKTLNMYVNDAIGYHMRPEQPLVYSDVAFGTADAIAFNEKDKFLRIHDLKTGVLPVHVEQLLKYAALFCLEYNQKPGNIGMELRFYQNNDIFSYAPTAEEIVEIMDIYVKRSKEVIEWRTQGGMLP